jgi:hypothetical protein
MSGVGRPTNPLSSRWEERAGERRFAGPIPAAPSAPNASSQAERLSRTALGARVGSFDTDAFGVLLRMKIWVCQEVNDGFMLSSQPQAGVSKHPTRLLMPACKNLSQVELGARAAGVARSRTARR